MNFLLLLGILVQVNAPNSYTIIDGTITRNNNKCTMVFIISGDECKAFSLSMGIGGYTLSRSSCSVRNIENISKSFSSLLVSRKQFANIDNYPIDAKPIILIRTIDGVSDAIEIEERFTSPLLTMSKSSINQLINSIRNNIVYSCFNYEGPADEDEIGIVLKLLDDISNKYEDYYIRYNSFLACMFYRALLYRSVGITLPDLQLNRHIIDWEPHSDYLFKFANSKPMFNYSMFWASDPKYWQATISNTVYLGRTSCDKGEQGENYFTATKFMYFYGSEDQKKYIKEMIINQYQTPGLQVKGLVSDDSLRAIQNQNPCLKSLLCFIFLIDLSPDPVNKLGNGGQPPISDDK